MHYPFDDVHRFSTMGGDRKVPSNLDITEEPASRPIMLDIEEPESEDSRIQAEYPDQNNEEPALFVEEGGSNEPKQRSSSSPMFSAKVMFWCCVGTVLLLVGAFVYKWLTS